MSEESAFVAALVADPSDDTTALVFADWLDERGDPRGAMIRIPEVRVFMWPEYANPLPKLRAALEGGKRVNQVNEALALIGEAAVSEIVPLLAHPKAIVRLRTMKALRRMANKARPAIPQLLEFVKGKNTDDETARREAVRLLGVLRVKQDATDEMAKGLESEDDSDRLAAVQAMAKLRTKTAAGSLCKALADSSEAVRRAAAQQLSYLASPSMTAAVEPLRAALADDSAFVRSRAAAALAKIGPKAVAAVPELARVLSATRALERVNFLDALGKVGVGNADALDALLAELRRPDAGHAAVKSLAEWPALPPSAAPAILDYVRGVIRAGNLNFHLRPDGIRALARINPPTGDVLDVMREQLDTDMISSDAAKALGEMGPAAAPLVPDLAAALGRGHRNHRDLYAVSRALGKIGGDGVTALAKALDHDGDEIPVVAAAGLREAGAAALPALPVLLARLAKYRGATPDRTLLFVASALAAIGSPATAAVPDLVALLLTPDCKNHVAERLCESLAAFGPAVLPFAPQLAEVLNQPARSREHDHVIGLLTALVPHGFDGLPVFQEVLRRATAEYDGNRHSSNTYELRTLAMAAVGGIAALGPKAEKAVEDLVRADQKFNSENLREKVLDAFGAIGGTAVPHIRAAMAHPSHDTRVVAIRAIVASGDVSSETQDLLRKLETDANKTVRLRATAALKQMGTPKRKRK